MKQKTRMTALALAGALGLTLVSAGAAEAGSKGRRNTAIAAGAVGIYGLVKKQPLVAGLGLGVAGYSYARSRQAASAERRRRHARAHRRHALRHRHRSHYCRHR